MHEQLERNKQTVAAFYDLMFNQCQPAEAMERYSYKSLPGMLHSPQSVPACRNDGALRRKSHSILGFTA
jgi:hypothetical protein